MNVRRTVPRVVPWLREKTRSPADCLEPRQDRFVGGVDQGTVVRLDHPDGRPHDPGQLESRDSGGERV